MKFSLVPIAIAIITNAFAVSEAATITLDESASLVVSESGEIRYSDWPNIAVTGNLQLPAKEMLIELAAHENASQISIGVPVCRSIGRIPSNIALIDLPTSLDSRYEQLAQSFGEDRLGYQPVYVMGETEIESRRFARVMLFPVTYNSTGELFQCDSLTLLIKGQAVTPERVAIPTSEPALTSNVSSDSKPERNISTPSADYVIITSAALADAFDPLATYKTQTGYRTNIMLTEQICRLYSGRDDAEKVREYLKDFYAGGGRYVLLGGDETIVPIRCAYHGDSDEPVDPSLLQVADQYFADLSGNWNRDNDSVWGERTDDAPDLSPELLVGRLPVNTPEEVSNYVDKLNRYETDPGNGDPSYLNRTFFFSSDQMRDYSPVTQHGYIAQAFPLSMAVDTVTGVEAVRGDDPAPSNLAPSQMETVMSQGIGIINVIAHGRDDGFAVKTAGYNEGLRAMLWTNPVAGESGSFEALQATDRPAFYYSLACDNGAFDKSSPPFNYGTRNMAQELIAERDGAVGMVAQSRWGWIGTSYILQKTFFDSLFAHPDRPASAAMYACKSRYPYYRDLILGQNYFGDPTMLVYSSVPMRQTIDAAYADKLLTVTATANGRPVSGARIVISDSTGIIAELQTGASGTIHVELASTLNRPVCISAIKTGCTVAQAWVYPSIVTDVDDSEEQLPTRFELSQNYPNPFNPSTQISFALTVAGFTTLTVYDLLGREVKTLVNSRLPFGQHRVEWTGADNQGSQVAAGVYFYRLMSGANMETKKMLLLK